jgi:hypothetical protein
MSPVGITAATSSVSGSWTTIQVRSATRVFSSATGILHQLNVFLSPRTKKADVVEHPKAFGHVGLLFNKPLGRTELLFV